MLIYVLRWRPSWISDIGLYGNNVSKRFFSETTRTVETKPPRNDHWKVLYKLYVFSLALIIFVVSEKKAFEHFPIGSNVNLCPTMAAILL
jgi:hypothetical protein